MYVSNRFELEYFIYEMILVFPKGKTKKLF